MIKLFFKTALRNISKDLNQSILNITGLALGFAALIYISTYVFHEFSYDKFHEKKERIYKSVTKVKMGGTQEDLSNSEVPLAPAAKRELPEVEEAIRLFFVNDATVQANENKLVEKHLWYAEDNFFKIFDFKLLEGDKNTALASPKSIVLTKSAGKKYFGDMDPMGKSIRIGDNQELYQITGILEDVPENSHLQFGMLASFNTVENMLPKNWGNFLNIYTYFLVKKNTNIDGFKIKYADFVMEYYEKSVFEYMGITKEDFEKKGNYIVPLLLPLTDIHLNGAFTDNILIYGNKQFLIVLGLIGLFIIVIACFNFINLTTAKASLRSKEISIKKISGSSKIRLVGQLLFETFLQNLLSIILAIIVLIICLPLINQITELNIKTSYLSNTYSLISIFIILLVSTILSGIYPSFTIAKYNPSEMIRSTYANWNSKSTFRNSLVVFQFVLFIILLCGSIIIRKQINTLHTGNPGFQKENIVVIENTNKLRNNQAFYKEELLKIPQISSASYASSLPSLFYNPPSNPFKKKGDNKDVFLNRLEVDKDFQKTLDIKLLSGRFFSPNTEAERKNAVINKAAVQLLGWDANTDKVIFDYNDNGQEYNVIGIIEDFNIQSLKTNAVPLIIRIEEEGKYLALHIDPNSAPEVLEKAKKNWEEIYNEAPFEYFFLDKAFDAQYKSEVKLGKLISLFSVISILIACFGLLGLVSFASTRKRKEIGVRKVNGAKLHEVLAMLCADFVKWIVIAFIVACPIAWYAMSKWLENFAYKTEINWWVFVLVGVITLIIALITVSWQSWRAANRNPVEALRYE